MAAAASAAPAIVAHVAAALLWVGGLRADRRVRSARVTVGVVTTAYGGLVPAKTVLPAGAAALGGATRARLRAGRVPVLGRATVEVLLPAAATGTAATLTHTA